MRQRGNGKYNTNAAGTVCSNCGLVGHVFRNCVAPVTSYGVIMVRTREPWDAIASLSKHEGCITGMEMMPGGLEFLLIQRRDSIGFIEMMRGKYKINDIDYIRQHIAGMTANERERYRKGPFHQLWKEMWGEIPQTQYKNEYEHARQKWEDLLNGVTLSSGEFIQYDSLLESVGQAPNTPEWGFPKGRRDARESDFTCAMREMMEETGVSDKDVIPIGNIEPLSENFFGSNHVHYCHKYYIVWVPSSVEVKYTTDNIHMKQEIGDIRWCTIDEALQLLRSVEKREILLRAAGLFRNLCALPNVRVPLSA
jgi:8-oxo-dGTP pyrophosphatase MutT (NUDIX family)